MKRKAAGLLLSIFAALSFTIGNASAAPPPIDFCLPDLDGHCRPCQLRFDPVSIRCLG